MSFNSIVIVREVWDTRDLVGNVLDDSGNIKESGLQTRFEPEDLNALEMALKIKDEHGGAVTAISAGKVNNIDVLRECLYRGVDKVIRINIGDEKLDSISLGNVYSQAIKKIGAYDLLFCGVNVVEGENSHPGVVAARMSGIEHISYIDNIEKIGEGIIQGKRAIEMGYEVVESKLPAAIIAGVSLLKDDPRTPRSAKAKLKLKMKKVPIESRSISDLGIDDLSKFKTTSVSGYEAVLQKEIESKQIDPKNEAELKQMLEEIIQ